MVVSTTVSRGARHRPTAIAVTLSFFAVMLGATIPTPLYPIYSARMGLGAFLVTAVFAVYAVGVVVALLAFAHLSDVVGRRRVLVAGVVVALVAAVIFLAGGGLFALLAARVLTGISTGLFTGTATAALIDLAGPDDGGGGAGYGLLASLANMLGLGFGPVFGGVFAEYSTDPLRTPFLAHLALLVAVGIGLLIVPRGSMRGVSGVRWAPQRIAVPREARPVFVRSAVAGLAGFAVLGFFNAVAPSFLLQVLHDPDHLHAGAVVFAFLGPAAVGQFAGGRAGERWALLGGCAALAAGAALIGLSFAVASLPVFLVAAVVAGVGQGASFRAGLGAVALSVDSARRGEATSCFFLVLYVAIALPVLAVGVAVQGWGIVVTGVVFGIVVALVSGAALVAIARAAPAVRPAAGSDVP